MRYADGFMHGVNLGGWLSQIDNISEEHFRTFITENDIAYIASMGLDHVRVPIDYSVIEEEDGTVKESGYKLIDSVVGWCKKHNLHIILDLHETFGYSFDPLKKNDKTIFFYNEDLQERFFSLWTRIAERYKGYSDFVAYELLNEIVEPSVAENWNKIALKAVEKIHAIAPDNWVIFGGVMYNSVVSVPQLPNTTDRKVMYTFHCYEPLIFTHQGAYWVNKMPSDFRMPYPAKYSEFLNNGKMLDQALAGAFDKKSDEIISPTFFEEIFTAAIKTSADRDIPIYCGEYGVIDLADNQSKLNWIKDIRAVFKKYNIGSAYWNYKSKDFGIVDIADKEVRDTLCQNL